MRSCHRKGCEGGFILSKDEAGLTWASSCICSLRRLNKHPKPKKNEMACDCQLDSKGHHAENCNL